MDERYEDQHSFGQDNSEPEKDSIEDEVVEDELLEEEPTDESEGDDEQQDESSDDQEEKPEIKQRDKAQVRINRLIKEKYKVASKAEKAAADADYWRQKYELSSQLNLRQSDLNASARLEKARVDYKTAVESGDADAQTDAINAIAAAQLDVQEVSKEKLRSEYDQKIKQYQSPPEPEAPDMEIINEWKQENSDWMSQESEKFDEDLTKNILQFDYQLGTQLRQEGRAHLIGTSEYIDKLDEFKEAYLRQKSRQGSNNQSKDLNMKKARGGAAPVRGSSQAQYRNSASYQLTPAEKAMVDSVSHAGVSEEIFKKAKLKYLKEEAAARGAM